MAGDRCSKCHRYKKDPPTPEIGHDGSHAESKCHLDHHPFPCDFVDSESNPCTAQATLEKEMEASRQVEDAKRAEEMENKLTSQSSEMEELKNQMLEMRHMLSSMRPAADTRSSLVTTHSIVTSAPHSIAVTTIASSGATGSRPSVLPSPVTSTADLVADAQSLLHLNQRPPPPGSHLPGYTGPTMKDLQQDKTIASEVQRQVEDYISKIPGLQKIVAGQPASLNPTLPTSSHYLHYNTDNSRSYQSQQQPGAHHLAYQAIQDGATGGAVNTAGVSHKPKDEINLLDMDTMLGLTVRERQYRPHEFAMRGNFFYARNINERNITLPLYMYGYLKHCIILLSGLVPVAEGEVNARLINLMNICEITSNNSTLSDFDHPAWQLGRGYGDRVLNDIQQGLRGWSEMPNHILPDVFLHVKDMVDMQTKKKDDGNLRGGGRGKKGAGGQPRSTSDKGVKVGEKPLVCSSYNDFFTGSGCAYEFTNGRKCTYDHYCSKCFAGTGNKIAHKGRFCSGTGSATAASTPVTTSG